MSIVTLHFYGRFKLGQPLNALGCNIASTVDAVGISNTDSEYLQDALT